MGSRVNKDTGTDELLCHVEDGVGVITLNRPESRNALSDRLTPAMRRMVAAVEADDDAGALVITGAGTAFCAGGDVKAMNSQGIGTVTATFDQKVANLRERQRTLTGALVQMRKPTIAALPGPAAGAGLSIALACDIRFVAESAFVSTGYARVGLSGDYGIAWLLTRAVGSARARELLFTAERIDAARMERMGMANRVIADADLMTETTAFARSIANGPRVALGLMKSNLDEALDIDFLTALDREAERLIQTAQTDDHKEAVRAFVEKRPPAFTGQ